MNKNIIIFSIILFSSSQAMEDTDYRKDIDYLIRDGESYFFGIDHNTDKLYQYERDDLRDAFQHDPKFKIAAQFYLGQLYYLRFPQNYQKAQMYLQQIAQQDINQWAKAAAQYRLGQMFYFGKGIKRDSQKAQTYFQQAAKQDINQWAKAAGQSDLGHMYYLGNGVEKNYEQAQTYFQQAAKQDINQWAKTDAKYFLSQINKD